ncbi:hypothetical protein [Streptomyces sp. NPDC051214]|uniref:hypothetical protein n=1 Tax=Streptomyces sp. NPDC051214 TaxID=3155282 RepID=UPI003430CF0F
MRVGITGHRGLTKDVERQVRALPADEISRYRTQELVALCGTADVVAYAERTGVPVRVAWPKGASR